MDKTEYIWNLVDQGKERCFLSRPRRFGKLLTAFTLMAVFEEKKDLFGFDKLRQALRREAGKSPGGYSIRAEKHPGCGRIDGVIQTDDRIYQFDFKLDRDEFRLKADRGGRENFNSCLFLPRRIMLICANFDPKTGKLFKWKN